MNPTDICAATLKSWLSDNSEIALLDVREHGQYGEGHLFFAVPLPYSRFELGLPARVAPSEPTSLNSLRLEIDGSPVCATRGRADNRAGHPLRQPTARTSRLSWTGW